MKYADLPELIVTDWLTPEEEYAWKNHPTGEMCFGIWKAQGRFLWHHRGDDFPTDAEPLDQWVDLSGTCWSFYPPKGWLNLNIKFTTGELVYKELE